MKRRIFFLSLILMQYCVLKADNYTEAFNIISDDYSDSVCDIQIIRPINGGTIITPVFDSSCPEEFKSPFSLACKIVEEYMPPSLPLTINVSCGRVNGSTQSAISKVQARSKENFGQSAYYRNAQMSVI